MKTLLALSLLVCLSANVQGPNKNKNPYDETIKSENRLERDKLRTRARLIRSKTHENNMERAIKRMERSKDRLK